MLDRSAWAGPGPTAPRPERGGELTRRGDGPGGGSRARRNVERTEQKEAEATKLQEAAYGAQLAAGLRVSDLATAVLISADGTIHHRSCAAYIHALQCSDWYAVAFTGYTGPVTVAGGKGAAGPMPPAGPSRSAQPIGTASASVNTPASTNWRT